VERLEDQDQVVRAVGGELGGVGLDEAHAAVEPGLAGARAGVFDRGLVRVEAVDVSTKESHCDRDAGEALAAAEVGHVGVPGALQPRHHIGHRSEPVGHQLVVERGPVDVALAVAERLAIGAVGHAAARAVGLGDLRQHAADPRQEVRERRHVRGVVRLRQHTCVLRGQRVAAMLGGRVGVLDLDKAGDGLLLEPLSRVALGYAAPLAQPGRREPPVLGQGSVKAQLGPEVDREQLERADRRAEQALNERLHAIGHRGAHRATPAIERGPSRADTRL
jgi:hypothetical protein